jgi:hypothetical protein
VGKLLGIFSFIAYPVLSTFKLGFERYLSRETPAFLIFDLMKFFFKLGFDEP